MDAVIFPQAFPRLGNQFAPVHDLKDAVTLLNAQRGDVVEYNRLATTCRALQQYAAFSILSVREDAAHQFLLVWS